MNDNHLTVVLSLEGIRIWNSRSICEKQKNLPHESKLGKAKNSHVMKLLSMKTGKKES